MRAEFCWAAPNDRLLSNLLGLLKITCFKALESQGVKPEDVRVCLISQKNTGSMLCLVTIFAGLYSGSPKRQTLMRLFFLTTIIGHYKLAICMTTLKSDKFRGSQGRKI